MKIKKTRRAAPGGHKPEGQMVVFDALTREARQLADMLSAETGRFINKHGKNKELPHAGPADFAFRGICIFCTQFYWYLQDLGISMSAESYRELLGTMVAGEIRDSRRMKKELVKPGKPLPSSNAPEFYRKPVFF